MTNNKFILLALTSLMLIACNDIKDTFFDTSEYDYLTELIAKHDEPTIEVKSLTFSPDYKTFTVTTNMLQDIKDDGAGLADSTHIRREVVEKIDGVRCTRLSTPRLAQIRNLEAEGVAEADVRMLVLVDLTLPQRQLDSVRANVSNMRMVFNHDNLFIAFMNGDTVSQTVPATDYVVNNYFKHSDKPHIFLYRSMYQKMTEMKQRQGVWQDADKMVMVTFAGDRVYDDDTNQPIDPNHYYYEEQLLRNQKDKRDTTTFLAYYVSLSELTTDEDELSLPWLFCSRNGGVCMKNLTFSQFKRHLYDAFHLDFADNEFVFVNPDYKVYRGDTKVLTVNFYNIQNDSLVASFTTSVQLGKIYKPIIVNGHSVPYVIVQGFLLFIFVFLLVYLLLQVVVPVISFLIFRRRYVVRYTGSNMSVRGIAVGDTCYLCKAPFQEGDKVVVKCEHTMHKSCWDENEYHCPEYGDRCKHGSHYFNAYNLFDIGNAPYYMRWVLVAIVCSLLAWLSDTIYVWLGNDMLLSRFSENATQVPFFGFSMGFFLTLGMSILAVDRSVVTGWASSFIRATLAGLICYATVLLANVIITIFNIQHGLMLIGAIPWIIASFVIVIFSTLRTRVVYNWRLVLISFVLGLLSMAAWSLFYQWTELDFRVVLHFSFLIYFICFAVSLATVAPRSERYFLHVEGAVKTMDIALYKWFRNQPDRVVTIGLSVDCTLQLSWDLQSPLAPVQAEIRLIRNVPYLIALEPGVLVRGKALRPNRKLRLYHGRSFTIGQTTFTYIEKDR